MQLSNLVWSFIPMLVKIKLPTCLYSYYLFLLQTIEGGLYILLCRLTVPRHNALTVADGSQIKCLLQTARSEIARMGWWGLLNLFPPSKTDEQRSRKKLLERELAEKKLAIKGQSHEKLNSCLRNHVELFSSVVEHGVWLKVTINPGFHLLKKLLCLRKYGVRPTVLPTLSKCFV